MIDLANLSEIFEDEASGAEYASLMASLISRLSTPRWGLTTSCTS